MKIAHLPLCLLGLNLAAAVPAAFAEATASPAASADPFIDTVPREAVLPRLRTIANDSRFRLTMHDPVTVMTDDGRQPYLSVTADGTLLCQAQLRARPFDSKGKYVYHYRIGTVLSRDGGATWQRFTVKENHDDVYTEGGFHQEPDGTILMLDTFVMPAKQAGHGVGELWKSHDDLHTWEGPYSVDFALPGIRFGAGSDDRGVPLPAAWLHRSMLGLPNGDLLVTMYSWFTGDTAPAAYMPAMPKARSIVIRSRDHGASWAYLSTIAVDGGVGTEGFVEPVLVRVSQGAHAGRLLCYMRTGREMYGAHSDDDGASWSRPLPVRIPGIDVHRTDLWAKVFPEPKDLAAVPTDELIGAMVDPDLTEMRDGTLVCAVGLRAPARKYRQNWHAPQNGDYLAFSADGGDTWSHVVQITSGAPTTQYMGIREAAPGVLYVVYDDSVWKMSGRAVGFRLDVQRTDR